MVDNTINSPDNQYNYDNNVLSGPGTVENLVRSGLIVDPNFVMQPRTGGIEAITIVDAPTTGPVVYDKRKSLLHEIHTDFGREYLNYSGTWCVEFVEGNKEKAEAYRNSLFEKNIFNFIEKDSSSGSYIIELPSTLSNEKIAEHSLDLAALREVYDNAEEITPYFEKSPKIISAVDVGYFLVNDIKQYEEDRAAAVDMKLFDANDVNNQPAMFFGGHLTGQDIGFYIDKGGRLRATYDMNMLFRSKPLLDDLIAYGKPEDYMAATYPSGTVQFVASKSLTDKLLKAFNTHEALAKRYNDESKMFKDFTPGTYPEFEDVLDVTTGKFHSANDLFGYTTDEEKK